MDNFCKTPEQICEELKHVSPLALPGYLMNCELHEQQQVEEIIDEAVRDLEKQGGVTQSLIDVMLPTSVQAVGMVSLKYLNKNLYDKALKGKINFGGILKQVIDFQYDSNFIALSKGGD